MRRQLAERLRQEERGVAHEVIEVLLGPEEVSREEVESVVDEAGVGASLAVIDEAEAGCAGGLGIDGLKRVARRAQLREDHGSRLEVTIHRHLQVLLLLFHEG